VEFTNLISGMAPHYIVYTKHLVTAILAKARACYGSRQQLFEALKFYVDAAEDRDRDYNKAEEGRVNHIREVNELRSIIEQLQSELAAAGIDIGDLNDELDTTREALDREQADNTRSKRLQESEDRLYAI